MPANSDNTTPTSSSMMPAQGSYANQEGLTIVTVGHLAPKRDQNINFNASGNHIQESVSMTEPSSIAPSTSPPRLPHSQIKRKSMRVERHTYIRGWTVPPKVLLVDDDKLYLKLSSKFLNVAGCTYDVAVDGVEALNKLNLERYDLVLMDIVMPNLDGIQTTSRIRQYDHSTPIISMTSNTTDTDILNYFASGMNGVLQKPFSEKAIVQLLEKHCGHLKAMQQWMDQSNNSPFIGRSLGELGNSGELTRITPTSVSIQHAQSQAPSNGFEGVLLNPDFANVMNFFGGVNGISGQGGALNAGRVHGHDEFDENDERGSRKRAKLELLE